MKDVAIESLRAVVPAASGARIAGPSASGGRNFKELLAERKGKAGPPGGGTAGACVQRLVEDLGAGNRVLDEIIAAASRGMRFSPQQLLVLQAQIYRLGEQAALATKVAEQAASEFKRLWQMQV